MPLQRKETDYRTAGSWSLGSCLVMTGLMFLAGCVPDPSHDNPLDPLSPRYTTAAAVSGTVTELSNPQQGLCRALVTIYPDHAAAVTDSAGRFTIGGVFPGQKMITFACDDFAPDSMAIDVRAGEKRQVGIGLNGLPLISGTSILTRKVDQLWPGPVYYADVNAMVDDRDGNKELDSVWLSIGDDGELVIPMTYNYKSRQASAEFSSDTLPYGTLEEWLMGRNLYVFAKDRNNTITSSPAFQAIRVIQQEALPTYPQNGDTVTVPFEMRWTAPSVSFNFSYSLRVVRVVSGDQILVSTPPPFLPGILAYQYTGTLPSGNYFWTISIVDEFGNWSRSKESYFVIP